MKKIIVPIDFSTTSKHAYLYARALASVFDASLKVIHVYSGSFDVKSPLVLKAGKGKEETVLEELQNFIQDTPDSHSESVMTKTKVQVEIAALEGFTTGEIVREARDSNAMMIIMGTTGSHDVLEKAIGSISTSVGQRAECPVLLIPKNANYEGFKHILYASNYESASKENLYTTIDFANIFRASIHFVHITEKQKVDTKKIEENIFNTLFAKGDPAFPFNLVSISSDSVVRGLNKYASENDIDLIVLLNRHRSFLDNILGKSTTKEMGLYTTFPLMIYPLKPSE